eukprot:s2357_g20.t1
MVDIQVKPHLDLTQKKVQENLLNKIASGKYFAVLLSPPCSTFSRVTWANRRGPRPVRSFVMPRGFIRLTWAERKRANWGNTMADFSFLAFAEQMKHADTMALFENPEDLGAIKSGEHQGRRPASMWQFEMFLELLKLGSVSTAAFYQEDFGTDYLKPTRLLLGGSWKLPAFILTGAPCFDAQGYYAGPLEARSAKRQLVGTFGDKFATSGSEQWPSNMCKWIAQCILENFSMQNSGRTPDLADEGTVEKTSDRGDYPVLKPDGRKLVGGLGEPRKCQPPGKDRDFHDGAGLLSMGRWDVEQRIWSMGSFWKQLRESTIELIENHLGDAKRLDRACFEMAVKGEAGCSIVADENLKEDIRRLWIRLLQEHGSKQEGLDMVAKGQPFFLRLMKELLAFGDDADRNFLMQGEVGYPVGVINPLPRTPHAYEEQTTWRLEDEPFMQEEVWRSNYQSIDAHVQFVRDHFEEECAEGLMERLTLEEAKSRFGSRVAVSSLAVLVEENHQGKRRVIHDATHGTKVNNRIRCRDKTRSPSAREKQYLLAYFQQLKRSVFSLVGDISKAHRRFLHSPEERGLLACRILETDDHIYINNVGTFGVACASYWWGRIAGAGIRLVHELLGPEMPVELLLFADDLEALGANAGGRRGITLAFLYMSTLGFPFKWSKQRGGLKVEWIGLFTDYSLYKLGMSPKRAKWLHDWVMDLATRGTTTSKSFEQGLGRLGFAAMALTWERPFLGPLYSWCAAVRSKQGPLKVPAMLRVILKFLATRFESGGEMQSPPPLRPEKGDQLLFYTDAKATEKSAWIGGFKQGANGEIISWFSEEITVEWAPWMGLKKDPKRVIAALELLASLVAVKLWMPTVGGDAEAVCWIRGKTDNQSNTFALTKWMSTKFPLTILIMELSESLRLGRCNLSLDWIPRDLNQLADDLTNEQFEKFQAEARVQPRLVTSGNTRGNIIGPVDKLNWADTSKVWSVPYKLKKEILGEGNLPLPGGACPVEHEADAPPRHVDVVPVFFHEGPQEVAMEALHYLQAVACIDLSPGGGSWALHCLRSRIPYTGVALTNAHKVELGKRLVSQTLAAMCNSNDAMYDPAFAEHLKQVAAADGHEIGNEEDPNNNGGDNQNQGQGGNEGRGAGRGGRRGRGGRGRGRGRGSTQPSGPQVDPAGVDARAALIAQIQAAAGEDGNEEGNGEGETGDA